MVDYGSNFGFYGREERVSCEDIKLVGAGDFYGLLLEIDRQVGRVRGLLRGSSIAMPENDNGSCTINWRNVRSYQLEL